MFPDDIGYASGIYEISILDTFIAIVLGKMRTEKKGLVYYPIYILADDKVGDPIVRSQIGVFEVVEKDCLSVLDEDHNLCLDKIDSPLLYSFVNLAFLKKVNSNPKKYMDNEEEMSTSMASLEKEKTEKQEKQEKTDPSTEDDIFSLKTHETKETKKIKERLKDGVFEKKPHFSQPPALEEELPSVANEIMADYKESAKDLWVQKYMKNAEYDIQEVESNGDCLFAVIRDAFLEKGQMTTVSKLRAIVANEVTDDIFTHQRELFEMYSNEKTALEKEIKNIKIDIEHPDTKEKIKQEKNKQNKKAMIESTNAKVKQFNQKVVEYDYVKQNVEEYKHMKNIDTIEGLRQYIMTSSYWADAWAIYVLEQNLKMKIIVFSEKNYTDGDIENVIHCGYNVDENTTFSPKTYIMTTYSGDHYRLITYKHRRLLTFDEIPYHVKILIVKKCMEKNAGIYNSIQDFRDFKSRLHVSKDEESESVTGGGMDDIVFTFHKRASDALPGKGTGEKLLILESQSLLFAPLAKIDKWRRKLDDSWEHHRLLRVDNKMWNSVEHYMLGAHYKKGFPDIYLKFSCDSGSDISGDLALAKKCIVEEGVLVDGQLIKGKKDLNQGSEHREHAVRAKFTQNMDLKHLLLSTHEALLQKFVSGESPVKDLFLMKVRKELTEKN
jgi:hypothetical protein